MCNNYKIISDTQLSSGRRARAASSPPSQTPPMFPTVSRDQDPPANAPPPPASLCLPSCQPNPATAPLPTWPTMSYLWPLHITAASIMVLRPPATVLWRLCRRLRDYRHLRVAERMGRAWRTPSPQRCWRGTNRSRMVKRRAAVLRVSRPRWCRRPPPPPPRPVPRV